MPVPRLADEVLAEEIHARFEHGSYYHNSLLISFFEGSLGLPPNSGRFHEPIADVLEYQLGEYLVRDAEVYQPDDRRQQPVVYVESLYHYEFTLLLFEALRRTLSV